MRVFVVLVVDSRGLRDEPTRAALGVLVASGGDHVGLVRGVVVHVVVHVVINRVRRERAVRIAPSDVVVRRFLAIHLGAVCGVRLFVVVAERDDELRDARALLHLDLDVVDERGALAARRCVLEIELLADLEEAELAERGYAGPLHALDASAHRRRETVDVETHLAALRRVDGDAVLDHADDALERHGARGVEIREPDPELASVTHVVLPEDLSGRHDDHALPRVEATRDGLTDLGQVRGAEVHALFREVYRLRLERRTECSPDLDHSFKGDPRRVRRAAIACIAHENSPLGVRLRS